MNQKLKRWCEEPFRVFFPFAFLASIIGVLLWPLSYAGMLSFHPLETHSRLMIMGFGGFLIVGFIGTAGPRFLGSEPWSWPELSWHFAVGLAMLTALIFGETLVADLLAGFWLLGVMGSMVARLLFGRNDIPPLSIPLLFLALLTGAVASFALALHQALGLPYHWHQFWRLLCFQGFLWLPIIGVAPYLLPRFFERQSWHSFPEGLTLSSAWLRYAILSLVIGILLIVSFALEIWLSPRLAPAMRASLVIIYLAFLTPGLFSLKRATPLALSLRWFPWCASAGWLGVTLFPALKTGVLHLTFIGGAAVVMFAVSTRVILGHNERHDRLASPLKWYHLVWTVLLLTAATRLSADFVPKVRVSHLGYASGLWAFLVLLWTIKVRKELAQPKPAQDGRKSCPRRRRKSRSAIPKGPTL